GERIRPLHTRDAAARGRRLTRGHRPSGARPRPRARQDVGPRGARPGPVPLAALRGGGDRVLRRRRTRADQRLRAVLPRTFAPAARPARRGAPPAGPRVEPAPRAERLPQVPRPGAQTGRI
ncbi:MAG: hypothetical protein AVDCRST_MAG85-4080, partial [uncultured Solirubrobacteraceae bacterium]